MIYTRRTVAGDRGELRVLFEQMFGEPGAVAVSFAVAGSAGLLGWGARRGQRWSAA